MLAGLLLLQGLGRVARFLDALHPLADQQQQQLMAAASSSAAPAPTGSLPAAAATAASGASSATLQRPGGDSVVGNGSRERLVATWTKHSARWHAALEKLQELSTGDSGFRFWR